MKYAIIVALWAFAAACAPPQTRAQQDSARTQAGTTRRDMADFARHTIYLEALGNGIGASLNYDFRFTQFLSVRVGIPPLLMLQNLAGSRNHLFEFGTGYGYSEKPQLDLGGGSGGPKIYFSYLALSIAYRYQPWEGGMFFKIALTPYFGRYSSFWAGIAVGYTF